MTVDTSGGPGTSRASIVTMIAGLLRGRGALSLGDVAALRRMDPCRPAAAFFKLEGLALDDHLPGDAVTRADLETRWAAVVVGLAHLGDLHDRSKRLGLALAEVQYAEIRFARLLRADVDRLADEITSLARFLSAKSASADWTAAADLMFSAGHKDEESVRRHLARDYYGALARAESR